MINRRCPRVKRIRGALEAIFRYLDSLINNYEWFEILLTYSQDENLFGLRKIDS